MKKIAIIALKDEEDCFYSFDMDSSGPTNLKKLPKQEIIISNYSVFPDCSIPIVTRFKKGLKPTVLVVEAEMSPEEFSSLRTGNQVPTFYGRKIRVIKEMERPFQYGYRIFEKRLKVGDKEGLRIWENLSLFWTTYGFNNRREYKAFVRLSDLAVKYLGGNAEAGFIHLSVHNRDFLKDILKSEHVNLKVFDGGTRHPLNIPKTDIKREISELPEELFAAFHHKTNFMMTDKFASKSYQQRFFQLLKEKHGYSVAAVLEKLPDRLIKTIDADIILQEICPELYALKKSQTNEERMEKEVGVTIEMNLLKDIFPRVTTNSLPELRTLCFEKIEGIVPEAVRDILKNKMIVFLN